MVDVNGFGRSEWCNFEPSETETIVYMNLYEGQVVLYTSDWRLANRLIKRGLKPGRVSRTSTDKKICALDFMVDKEDRKAIGKLLSPAVLVPGKRAKPCEKGT